MNAVVMCKEVMCERNGSHEKRMVTCEEDGHM